MTLERHYRGSPRPYTVSASRWNLGTLEGNSGIVSTYARISVDTENRFQGSNLPCRSMTADEILRELLNLDATYRVTIPSTFGWSMRRED